MPGTTCCIKQCEPYALNSKSYFFSFPKDTEKRKLWIKNIPENQRKNWFSKSCKICHRHFEEKYLKKERQVLHNGHVIAREPMVLWRLTDEAVPTIFSDIVPVLKSLKRKRSRKCSINEGLKDTQDPIPIKLYKSHQAVSNEENVVVYNSNDLIVKEEPIEFEETDGNINYQPIEFEEITMKEEPVDIVPMEALDNLITDNANESPEKDVIINEDITSHVEFEVVNIKYEPEDLDVKEEALSPQTLEGEVSEPEAITCEIDVPSEPCELPKLIRTLKEPTNTQATVKQKSKFRHFYKPGLKIYQCPECDRKFKKIQNFKKHFQEHFDERAFQCAECSLAFKCSNNLIRHQHVHVNRFSFQCNMCFLKVEYPSQVRKHSVLHNLKNAYKCAECSQMFSGWMFLKKAKCSRIL